MKIYHWITAGLGLIMFLAAVWLFETSDNGLKIINTKSGELPVTLISPQVESAENRPLVLIGHGLAGSRVIMRGYAFTLAHAGYNVAMWDSAGHAGNPIPMQEARDEASLVDEAEAAREVAKSNGFATDRIAVLGHSMGSGMALSYGTSNPDTIATIAVSPVSRPVSPDLPRNLLLLAEGLDQRFVTNAENLLEQAGGAGGDLQVGTARKMVIIPGVEHISILFSTNAQKSARQWLDEIFGSQPGARDFTDRRMLWYLLGLAGTLLFFWSVSALINNLDEGYEEVSESSVWRRLGALVIGAIGASGILFVLSNAGLNISQLLNMLVGGYILVWFAIAGAISILLLGRLPVAFERAALIASLMIFAALWVGLGLLGNYGWLPWLLIPKRLILWPLASLLCLPWFMAVAQSVLPAAWWGRLIWWLGYTLLLIGGLFLSLRLNPELGFLVLILPVFPLVLGLHALVSGPYRWRFSFALGGSLFIGWLVMAVFPLI
jgi:dienelactone hydrolase